MGLIDSIFSIGGEGTMRLPGGLPRPRTEWEDFLETDVNQKAARPQAKPKPQKVHLVRAEFKGKVKDWGKVVSTKKVKGKELL